MSVHRYRPPPTRASCLVRFDSAEPLPERGSRLRPSSARTRRSSPRRKRSAAAKTAAHPQVRDGEADEHVRHPPVEASSKPRAVLSSFLSTSTSGRASGTLRHARLDPVHRLQPAGTCRADGEVQGGHESGRRPRWSKPSRGTSVYIRGARAANVPSAAERALERKMLTSSARSLLLNPPPAVVVRGRRPEPPGRCPRRAAPI